MNLFCKGLKSLNLFFTDSILVRDYIGLHIMRNLNSSDLQVFFFPLME